MLSNEINSIIQKYEFKDFSPICFGYILSELNDYCKDLRNLSEEDVIKMLKELKNSLLLHDIIVETTSASTIESICKREANNISDIENIISDEFKIFNIQIEKHEFFENRFEIKYYRNPSYNEVRHYVRVVVLTYPDKKTIKKILDVSKGN